MIVVDTNVITYLFFDGEHTAHAEKALAKDPEWAAPLLWRREFRNVLAFHIRTKRLSLYTALTIMDEAEHLIQGNEFDVRSANVLSLAESSGCFACDCEYAVLAKDLGIPLVTPDTKLLDSFPDMAVSLETFAG